MVSGNSYLTTSDHGLGFIVIRLFIYIALLLTCFLLNVSLRQVSENITIKEHAQMAENLLSLQREQYTRLIKNAEAVETMRHDIRHQLVAAKSFSQAGDNEGLNQYLDELYGNVPAPEKMYCKNYIVNAVVNHYLFSLEESIKLDVKLDIPEDTGVITSADLCVIMGNLLENAVEACRIIENSEQSENFIRAYSLIQGDCISIMVENSFNGICNEEDGIYYSHKRDNQREGIGLSSVKAVCEKYDGRTLIEVNDNVWKSSALVYMK
jgi:sensor histidine kinase regulating citrate/malate metabolism